METLNLGWGDPHFLLEILHVMHKPNHFADVSSISNCTYSPDLGEELLLGEIRQITKKLTGEDYKYFLITNGATQALNTIMRVWKASHGLQRVITSQTGYPYSHMMAKKSQLIHRKVDLSTFERSSLKHGGLKDLIIVESPSNPFGEQFYHKNGTVIDNQSFTVWDGVYHNPIYNACPAIKPPHHVFVGSFSKLLGLTGARVGWLATNHEYYFDRFAQDSLYENATVSKPSQKMIIDILQNIDLMTFMKLGKNSLDQNRQILNELSGLLGTDIQEKGMFYCAEVDDKMLNLFNKANVHHIQFEIDDKKFIRLNIGQTRDILTKAVKAIKKIDGR